MNITTRRHTRRALGAIAATAAAALIMGGCSAGTTEASDGPVTISFWGWVPGIEDAVALWNSEHPEIQVDFTRIASADVNNLPSQIDAGTAPDVAQVSINALPGYVIDQQVQDLTEWVGDDSALYTASTWAGVQFGDGIYAVPQDSSPNALLYRTDIFAQYGIAVPTTWDEYVAAAEALHAADPNVYIAQFSPNEVGLWQVDQLQAGGQWFGTDGDAWTIGIDDAATQPVAERYQYLLDNDLIKVEQMWTPEYWADVNNGVIASINYAAWFPVILAENAPALAGKWAVAPSPSDTGDGPSSDLGGSVNVVTSVSTHAEQAAEFITWLNSDPASLEILIAKGGLFPAAVAGFDTEALNATNDYWSGQNISEVFIAAAENVSSGSVAGPAYGGAFAAVSDEFATVVTGESTFAEALAAAAVKTRSIVESLGLTVK